MESISQFKLACQGTDHAGTNKLSLDNKYRLSVPIVSQYFLVERGSVLMWKGITILTRNT